MRAPFTALVTSKRDLACAKAFEIRGVSVGPIPFELLTGVLRQVKSIIAEAFIIDGTSAVEKTGRGGRVLDVETARHVPLGRVATSMPRLEERLGSYELAPAVAARDAREAERRAVGIAERVERLRAQPDLVLDRLAETHSAWNGADIEREVRSALGVRTGHDARSRRRRARWWARR